MQASYIKLNGTIVAETPLHLGDGTHLGIVKQTKAFIEGSVIRGAVGISLLRASCLRPEFQQKHEECPEKQDCLYPQLFEEEDKKAANIIFRNAYPYHAGCVNHGIYVPTAQTLYVCERCEERFNSYTPPLACPKCGRPLKSYEGYICTGCQHLTRSPVSILRMTSTAVDRYEQSAAIIKPLGQEEGYGTMHSIDLIPRETKYHLEVIVDPEVENRVPALTSLLEKSLPDEGIGGGKSRGLGKVGIRVDNTEKITPQLLRKRAEEIDAKDFSLMLLSDAILEKPTLPGETLSAALRRAYTKAYHTGAPRLPDLQLKDQRVRQSVFTGWNLREDKRRIAQLALKAGSVFHYISDRSAELADAIAALEWDAIGGYKPHGKGQVKTVRLS